MTVPVRLEDVHGSQDRAPRNGTAGIDQIKDITKIDDTTVVVHLRQGLRGYLSGMPPVLAEACVERARRTRTWPRPSSPTQPDVTSGPYTVSEFTSDDHVTT